MRPVSCIHALTHTNSHVSTPEFVAVWPVLPPHLSSPITSSFEGSWKTRNYQPLLGDESSACRSKGKVCENTSKWTCKNISTDTSPKIDLLHVVVMSYLRQQVEMGCDDLHMSGWQTYRYVHDTHETENGVIFRTRQYVLLTIWCY